VTVLKLTQAENHERMAALEQALEQGLTESCTGKDDPLIPNSR